MVQGTQRLCQHQYFPSRLAMDVVLTGLMCIKLLSTSLQVVFLKDYNKLNYCLSLHDPKCNMIDRDKREEEFYQCHLLQIGSSGN